MVILKEKINKEIIAFTLFSIINMLFYFKYLYRINALLAIIATLLYPIGVSSAKALKSYNKLKIPFIGWVGIFLLFFMACLALFPTIPKESLNVDRWEMIQVFWDSFLNGSYPYAAQGSNDNYPGPMPFYFFLCYPFYKIGEIGLSSILAIMIWQFYIYKKEKLSDLNLNNLLLYTSLAIYWEIFARSTILFNTVLFAIYFFSLKNLKEENKIPFYVSALIGGLLFSTRNVFIIPLLIWGIYALRTQFHFISLLRWAIVFLFAFILTFIPIFILGPDLFFIHNPFLTQGTVLLPFSWIICFLILTIGISFRINSFYDVVFYSGTLLFLIITGHVVYALINSGIGAYLTTGADISYYLFCFPFLLITMTKLQEEND